MLKLNMRLKDGLGEIVGKNFGLKDSATPAQAGAIVTAFNKLTTMGVVSASMTQTTKTTPTFTATTPDPASRWYNVGRITVGLVTTADGGDSTATIEIPGIKDALVSGNQVIDNGTSVLGVPALDGDIANFLQLFASAGVGRVSGGQAIASAVIVSSLVWEKAHAKDPEAA